MGQMGIFTYRKLRHRMNVENMLVKSNWFIKVAVIILLFSSIFIVFIGIAKFYFIIESVFRNWNDIATLDMNLMAVILISIIDNYLLAIIVYILAISIYKFFIRDFPCYERLKIASLDDLKSQTAKMLVLFLAVLLVQKIVKWDNRENIIYFGGIVIALSLMLILFSWVIQVRRSDALPDEPVVPKEDDCLDDMKQ